MAAKRDEATMKRAGHLFDRIVSWPNLVEASLRARRGKRFRPNVAAFEFNQEYELLRIQHELASGTYRPGPYRTFEICEPKRRMISAAPYRDRVVHHAVCNVIQPLFERGFIADSYACRVQKGTHAAIRRASEFCRQFPYVLMADVRKFFPSIDHAVLVSLIRRRIKDARVLALCELIVSHSNPQEPVLGFFPGDDLFTRQQRRVGIPIGNQTSQFFANIMLDPLDHFIKEKLQIRGFVRYADDLLLFGRDTASLHEAREEVRRYLLELRLRLHETKSVVFPVRDGIPFLGFRIFPTYRRIDKQNVRRFQRRMRGMQRAYARRELTVDQIRARIMSWFGHARHADSDRYVRKILSKYPFLREKCASRSTQPAEPDPQ